MIRWDAKNGVMVQCDVCGKTIHSLEIARYSYKKLMIVGYIKGLRLRRISGETIDTCRECRKRERF